MSASNLVLNRVRVLGFGRPSEARELKGREFYGVFGFVCRYKDDVLNPKRKDITTEKLPRNV